MAIGRWSLRFAHATLATTLTALIVASYVRHAGATENNEKIDNVLSSTMTSDVAHKSVGPAPAGAFGTTFQLSAGSLFAWQSKRPHQESDAEVVVIVIHGVDRNAGEYFQTINRAYHSARAANMPDAPVNTLRIAPSFFASPTDDQTLNATTLAWSDDNDWSTGYGSKLPSDSGLSSFSVLDELVQRYSDKSSYPRVRKLLLVGHGGGGMFASRYAALRQEADPMGVSLRYIVGNPSSMLYFTEDRPKALSRRACSYFNTFFYGLDDFDAPYPKSKTASELFQTFAQRDVRYLVGLADTSPTNGDESCGAKAQGGVLRKDRTLSYWKYIHLLAGANAADLSAFPGQFASLQASNSNVELFRLSSGTVNHKLFPVSGIGHDAHAMLNSNEGLSACFAS